MNDAWKQYADDFRALTDEEIDQECERCANEIEDCESWIEAVASWRAAGKPRGVSA